jgi:hypothetical protein
LIGNHLGRITANGTPVTTLKLNPFENFAMGLRPTEAESHMKFPFPERDRKSLAIKMLELSFFRKTASDLSILNQVEWSNVSIICGSGIMVLQWNG